MTIAKAPYDFDFAVAGGGPAGTSAAISLRQRGHSVVLFERDTFPRFHIGESLLSTANDAFAALGVTKRIEAACFPEKWGARLYTHDGRTSRYVDFTDVREVTRAQTYQVCRQEFDRILLERAREVGVDVREESNVIACEFTPDAAILDVVSRVDGATRRARVRALVDATGLGGLIARKFNLRTEEPRLANIAIYSHYTGVPRLESQRPDDIRLVARSDAGWFWLIPISKELTSVGVVLPKLLYRRLANGSPEESLNRTISDTPIVADLMRDARREWPVRVEKDFSYSASTYAGNRWILAGDAGAFLDPVFSTGVSIAMESGIEAGAVLHRALLRNDFSACELCGVFASSAQAIPEVPPVRSGILHTTIPRHLLQPGTTETHLSLSCHHSCGQVECEFTDPLFEPRVFRLGVDPKAFQCNRLELPARSRRGGTRLKRARKIKAA